MKKVFEIKTFYKKNPEVRESAIKILELPHLNSDRNNNYVDCLIDIMGNLQNLQYYKWTNKKKGKPYLPIPMKKDYYSSEYIEKNSHTKSINHIYSYRTVKYVIKKLLKYNILYKQTGVKGKYHSKFFTRNPKDWKIKNYFSDIMETFFIHFYLKRIYISEKCSKLLSDFNKAKKEYLAYLKDKNKDFKGNPIEDKNRICYIEPASDEQRKFVEQINRGFPENMSEIFYYTRSFGKTENDYGRFINRFQNFFSKKERNSIIEFYNYVEIDYDAFGLNVLYLLKTDNKYGGEDIYTDCIRKMHNLMNYFPKILKTRKEKQDYKIVYRYLIKQLSMIIMNIDSQNHAKRSINYLLFKYGCYFSDIGLYNGLCMDYNEGTIKQIEKFTTIFNRINWNKLMYKLGTISLIDKPIFLTIPEFLGGFLSANVVISDCMYKSLASMLQNIESRCIAKIMEEMTKDNLYPITVHDAFYVPKKFFKKYNKLKETILLEVIKENKEEWKKMILE